MHAQPEPCERVVSLGVSFIGRHLLPVGHDRSASAGFLTPGKTLADIQTEGYRAAPPSRVSRATANRSPLTLSCSCNRIAVAMTHHATRTLQEMGYRLTPQRTLVWDALREQDSHMSAEEICLRVQQKFPHVNISTIYRTLELLVSLGLVRETHLGSARRFEVEEEVPHHHLLCEGCGRVTHVHDEDLGPLGPALEREHGFSIRELTVLGRCRDCRDGCEEGDGRCISPTGS